MESQKLNNDKIEGFGVGRKKTKNYPPGGIQYFIDRVSNITGYRKTDVGVVLKCLTQVLDECVVEVSEDETRAFNFGSIEIYGKMIKRTEWTNPRTGEIVELTPYIRPSVRLRSKWRQVFSNVQVRKRKELNIDINGEPL